MPSDDSPRPSAHSTAAAATAPAGASATPAGASGASGAGADNLSESLTTGPLRQVLARPFQRDRQHRAPSRAGRNLPAAVAVAVVLIGALVTGLFFVPLVLALLAGAAAGIGVW